MLESYPCTSDKSYLKGVFAKNESRVGLNQYLLKDARDKSKIRSNPTFFYDSARPLLKFSRTIPFKKQILNKPDKYTPRIKRIETVAPAHNHTKAR